MHGDISANPASTSIAQLAQPKRPAEDIRALKARDNWTNFGYIAQVYLIVAATVVGTLWSFAAVDAAGLGWWWNIPMAALAVAIIGASQHQLGGITHEGTHYVLFSDRKTLWPRPAVRGS